MNGETLYKVLVDGKSCHGGTMEWSLPQGDAPGEWHRYDGALKICERGIHLTRNPMAWYKHRARIFEAEADGIAEWQGDKCVAQAARLIREVEAPALWARIEKFVDGIASVQWFKPDGKPDPEWKLFTGDTWDTAGAAAWDAARATARAAAWDAARAAAWDAARAAARDAAWDAAWAAARAAAWAAARDAAWDAAWAAARDAAWDAAWAAARAAARDAAWAAAWDAARAAAWDAAGAAAVAADLLARIEFVRDLSIDPKHIEHAEARWRVWQKGYALLCDVDGVLYVYAKGGLT